MVLASYSVAALREMAERLCPSAGPLIAHGNGHSAHGEPSRCRETAVEPNVIRQAIRHSFLAVEMALASSGVQERLAAFLGAARASLFREQVEILLDLLGRSGLDCEEPDVIRDLSAELRSARTSCFSTNVDHADPRNEDASSRNGVMMDEAEWQWRTLRFIAQNLQQGACPHLARLVELRSLWDEPLFLGMVEYFLQRSLRTEKVEEAEEPCHCLETMALLLEEHEPAITEMLDQTVATAPTMPDQAADSRAAAALYQLGLGSSRRGDYRKAVTHFTAALKLDPANALYYHQRGEAYRLLSRYQRAIADLQVAARLSPEMASILTSRAMAYYETGEHVRCLADCTTALAIEADNADAYRTRARAHAELGSHAEAIADLTRVIALLPEDDEAHYVRGLSHARRQDFSAAVSDFTRTLELNPRHVPAWLYRGHAHRRLGDFSQAIADYTEVLRQHPGNALAHSGRGLACKLQGDARRAIGDFTEALRLGSRNSLDYYHRATLSRASGDLAGALADLDEAIRLQRDLWPALYGRGKILFTQGQHGLAVLDLDEVVRLQPAHVAGYLSRALAYDRLGDYPKALADAKRGLELEPGSAAAHLVRGAIHAHRGNRTAALADQSETIGLDGRLGLAYHERSMTYALQGEYDRALADCNQFIALEPGNAQGYATRSIVYHFKGEVAQAVTDYVRALQIDPKQIMTWWNEPLAESPRNQATQQIADYIDGLRHEASASQPSLPGFQIVVKLAGASNGGIPARPARVAARKVARKPAPEQPKETTDCPVAAPPPQPELHAESAASLPQSEDVEPNSATDELKPAIPDTGPIGLAPTEESSPELSLSDPAPAESRKPKVEEPYRAAMPASPVPTPMTCGNCGRQTIPLPVSEGRGRCAFCKSVFPLGGASRPAVQKKERKPPFLETWKRPLAITAGLAAAVLLLVVLGTKLFGNGRMRVYRAQGKADFEGKPMAKATLILHPVGERTIHFPLPCATVKEDGTFALGTYGKGDGAPAGEYKVTVQWVVAAPGSNIPVNVLPEKYSDAKTSDLTVRIKTGTNTLPPIQFTKTGRK
jgi:tetratricopeptide (TPR) repeat protein